MERCDVVVVGAGVAGLVAAERLAGAGVDVVVLEARDRVGGRVHTRRVGDDLWLDVGGQWLGPGQQRAYALVHRLGLTTFPTHTRGASLIDLGGRVQRATGPTPRLGPAVLADLGQGRLRFARLMAAVSVDQPWTTPDAARLDGQTFESWIRRTLRTRTGRAFFQVACEAVFATEPANLSLLHALVYVKSAGGWDPLLLTTGGAQQDRVVGGAQRIPEALAARLGDRVRLASPVREMTRTPDAVTVTFGAERRVLRARRAVVALPPALAGRIDYHPALPADRDLLTQRAPMGSVIKCHAVYDSPFWREQGLSGEAFGDRGPVKVVFDSSPPAGRSGVLLAFLEGWEAIELGRVSPEAREQAVLGSLARYFGPRAAHPVLYDEQDWSAEEWTRGCYGAHLPPGAWTQVGAALRQPVGRVHWAGTETATRWTGYIDGAAESGERAAAEVLAAAG